MTADLSEFTKRTLLSLMTDLTDAREKFQSIEAQITTLAKEHGLIPEAESSAINKYPGQGY
jgi:hypothetical protein